MAWWESCGYRSRSLPSLDSEEEEEEEEEEDDSSVCSTDSDSMAIHYVLGDVTHPHTAQGDAIIVHCVGKKHVSPCHYHSDMSDRLIKGGVPTLQHFFSNCSFVDDSGRWGRGGLFTALEVRSDEPRKQYELAGKMKGMINHDCKENHCSRL